jgi:hypothetical protein
MPLPDNFWEDDPKPPLLDPSGWVAPFTVPCTQRYTDPRTIQVPSGAESMRVSWVTRLDDTPFTVQGTRALFALVIAWKQDVIRSADDAIVGWLHLPSRPLRAVQNLYASPETPPHKFDCAFLAAKSSGNIGQMVERYANCYLDSIQRASPDIYNELQERIRAALAKWPGVL